MALDLAITREAVTSSKSWNQAARAGRIPRWEAGGEREG